MLRSRPPLLPLLIALASLACSERRREAPPAPATATAGVPATQAPAAPEPLAPPPAPPDQAEVKAAVEAWLAAQNQGNFASYQALYAEKLEGVKRVGARTWRFARDGWMADRQRMFKKPMTVAVRDLEISGSARTPVVSLVQSFRQGKFADEGPKRLVFTRAGGALRIAREEMLHSVVENAPTPATSAAMLTITLGATSYAVLDEPADASWGTGKLEGPMTHRSGTFFALRHAGKAPMPAQWKDRQLVVYSALGRKCEATIARLVLLSGGTPHFIDVQVWEGFEGAPPVPRSQRVREIYDLAPPVLAAELAVDKSCEPVLATAAETKATVFTPAASDGESADAVSAFRQLPAYRALQTEFTGTYGGKGEWAATPKTLVLEHGAQRVVLVWANQGSGCGDFYGALTAMYAAGPGHRLRLLTLGEPAYFEPRLVLDVDGDGVPEVVGTPDDFSTVSALYRWTDTGYQAIRSLAFPFNDCGC